MTIVEVIAIGETPSALGEMSSIRLRAAGFENMVQFSRAPDHEADSGDTQHSHEPVVPFEEALAKEYGADSVREFTQGQGDKIETKPVLGGAERVANQFRWRSGLEEQDQGK